MRLPAQTAEWYDRLATLQPGYYYPWRSQLDPRHGEDVYREIVRDHVRPDADALDAACGHGELTLDIAPGVRSVLGYDRTGPWVTLAERAARESGLANARFAVHDSSPEANGGRARIPRRTPRSTCCCAARGRSTGSRTHGGWRVPARWS